MYVFSSFISFEVCFMAHDLVVYLSMFQGHLNVCLLLLGEMFL
jgi:hypothetical protein